MNDLGVDEEFWEQKRLNCLANGGIPISWVKIKLGKTSYEWSATTFDGPVNLEYVQECIDFMMKSKKYSLNDCFDAITEGARNVFSIVEDAAPGPCRFVSGPIWRERIDFDSAEGIALVEYMIKSFVVLGGFDRKGTIECELTPKADGKVELTFETKYPKQETRQ